MSDIDSAALTTSAALARLMRPTSQAVFKTGIETVEPARADAVLKLRPIFYRSRAPGDNREWSYYGLVAEEVAQIDARLVSWGYRPDDYEEVLVPAADGSTVYESRLKDGAKRQPQTVLYDRVSVLLLDVVRRLADGVLFPAPSAPSTPQSTRSDMLVLIEELNEARAYHPGAAPSLYPILSRKAAAAGLSLDEMAASILTELAALKKADR